MFFERSLEARYALEMADSKIVVTHNFQRLSTLLQGLGSPKEIQKAVARSIRRTLPKVQKAAFTMIQAKKLLKLKQSEVKTRARSYVQGNAGTPVEEQYGKIWITPRPESLGKFYARKVAAGRSETVQRQDKFGGWQGIRLYSVRLNQYGAPYLKDPKRSFIAQKKGGPVVFKRAPGAKRLPIEKQKGPGAAELVEQTGIHRVLADVASVRYHQEFEHNVKFYAERALNRAKGIK